MEQLLDFPINPDGLDATEILYELRIRNKPTTGTGRQRLIELRQALEMEAKPPMITIEDDGEFNGAIEKLENCQMELKRAIKADEQVEQTRLKSKIRHYQDRAFRTIGKDAEKDAILYGIIQSIKRTIRMSESEINKSGSTAPLPSTSGQNIGRLSGIGRGRGRKPEALQKHQTSEEDVGLRKSLITPLESREEVTRNSQNRSRSSQFQDAELDNMFQDMRMPASKNEDIWTRLNVNPARDRVSDVDRGQFRVVERRRVAVEKWPIRYLGDDSPTLTDFLWKLELYAKADEVTMNEVFKGFFKLLGGVALEWFEIHTNSLKNWNELVEALKQRFLSKNHDFMMREVILERFQMANESIANYLMNMAKLFLKIYPPLEESYKVYVLQRNMLPHYRMQLSVAEITSVDQLEKLCKNMDEARYMDARFRAPQRTNKMSEMGKPNTYAYKCNELQEVARIDISKGRNFGNRQERRRPVTREGTQISCWNCRQRGHRHFDCPMPRNRIYCWCCGMEGTTADKCPRNHKGGNLFSCVENVTDGPSSIQGNGRTEP